MASLLEKIHSPEDIKGFGGEELDALCEEMRRVIIETVSANGGHLASNLGVVELTVALALAFSPPRDTIVWDVGHQSYPYKLLTGRYPQFSTIRLEGGLAGFPCREESEYDKFTSGHSSASISAALGVSEAPCRSLKTWVPWHATSAISAQSPGISRPKTAWNGPFGRYPEWARRWPQACEA